jgi:aminoglycoside phosphotransferase (APT) family kinase protein
MSTEPVVADDHEVGLPATEGSDDAAVRAWIEANVGPVVAMERQGRWRPAWYVDAQVGADRIPLYVRGARPGLSGSAPPRQEGQILSVLEEHGIPVPHVYGAIETPDAVTMSRLAGRPNLATADDDAQRAAVLADYVDVLARIHAIPPESFAAAGLSAPESASDLLLWNFERGVARFAATKARPEPMLEFAIRWIRRNLPDRDHDSFRFVLADSAQFMFEGDRITGVIDVELAHLGDPAIDLASFRLRDMSEPLGDVGAALRQYQELQGAPLDRDLIRYCTAAWIVCTPLGLTPAVHAAPPVPELMQYVEWFRQYSLITIEAIAECAGVALEPVALPAPSPSPAGDERLAAMVGATIVQLETPTAVDRYRRDAAAAMATYLSRRLELGTAVDQEDISAAGELLGCRSRDRGALDLELEAMVDEDDRARDDDLIRFFHARALRELLLLEPVLSTGSIKHLEPLDRTLGGDAEP